MGHYQFFQLLQTIKNNHEGKTQLFSFIVLTITKTICLKDFSYFTEKPFSIKFVFHSLSSLVMPSYINKSLILV